MEFVNDRTTNQHIRDHAIYYFELYPQQQEELEEFYLEWIELDRLPEISDYISENI